MFLYIALYFKSTLARQSNIHSLTFPQPCHPRNQVSLTGIYAFFLSKNKQTVAYLDAQLDCFMRLYKGCKSAKFQMHDYMPLIIDIKRLSDGDGIEATLIRHSASSYKACHVKFSQTKLDWLEKANKKSQTMKGLSCYICRDVLARSVLRWMRIDGFL